MKKVICYTHDLKSIQIIEVGHGIKPANFICDAPPEIDLGDEELVMFDEQFPGVPLINQDLLRQKREKQAEKPGWFSRKK